MLFGRNVRGADEETDDPLRDVKKGPGTKGATSKRKRTWPAHRRLHAAQADAAQPAEQRL
jgi:hypothetical protein